MSRPRTSRVIPLGLTIAIGLVLTPAAGAVTVDTFKLKSSHGYSMHVRAASEATCGCSRRFDLKVSKKTSDLTKSGEYVIKGGSNDHLVGDFGKLGQIDVRFRSKRTVHRRCGGAKIKKEIGTWAGTIRFRGEHGYTSVNAGHAKGAVEHIQRPWKCNSPHGVSGGDPLVELDGEGSADPGAVDFRAESHGVGSSTHVFASLFEDKGKAWRTRSVKLTGPESAFTYASDLSSAHLAPPQPFSGSADFTRGEQPNPDTWTGSLAVHLPGKKVVPLTGDFDVRLF